ncbi:MAG: DnaA N-terminal domain-containing protein, partial [Armatimonadota bacterium]
MRRAWDRALRGLAARVNKPTFEAHIRTLRPLSLVEEASETGGTAVYAITLGVPSAFTREWVSQRHGPLIQGLLEEVLDHDVRVRFVLTPRDKAATDPAPGRGKALLGEERENVTPAAAAATKLSPKSRGQEALSNLPGDLFDIDNPSIGVGARTAAKSPAETVEKARTNNDAKRAASAVSASRGVPAEPPAAPPSGTGSSSPKNTNSSGSRRSGITNDAPLLN